MAQKNKLESALYAVETITGIVVEVTPTDGSKYDPTAEYHLALYTGYAFGFPDEKPAELVRLAYPGDLPEAAFPDVPVAVGDRIAVMALYHPADMPSGYQPHSSRTDVIYPIVTILENYGQYHTLPGWLQE